MKYLLRWSPGSKSLPLAEVSLTSLLILLRLSRTLLLLTLSVLLCSCAGLPGNEQRSVTDSSKPLGPAVEQFSIGGRLLLKQGQRRDHLRFTWEHTTTTDVLLLSSALGQGVAKLTRDVQTQPNASLELADGKRYRAANWEALSQQVFGQTLPLDALPQWLRGAYPQWSGAQGKWQIVVSEAKAFESTPGEQGIRKAPLCACGAGRLCNADTACKHQLMPRVLQISADDIVLTIVVEAWGDDDE